MNDDTVNPYASPQTEHRDREPVVDESMDRLAVMCHVTEYDLLAWAMHFVGRTGVFSKARWRVAMLLLSLVLFATIVSGVLFQDWIAVVILTLPLWLLVGITVLILPSLQRRATINSTRQLYREGNGRNLLGDVRYVITPTSLRHETRYGQSIYYWQGLEAVEEGAEHLFVLLTSGSAYVIPMRDFTDEQHRAEFIAACKRFFEQAKEQELPLPPWA